jgi:tetratricopeptide (TPR) repeat protein
LLSLGRPAEALEWQRKARALDPRSSGGVRQIGLSLMALGRLDEARAHYREAVEQISKLFVLYVDAGDLEALGAGRWDEGLRWFLRGLQATPDEPELLAQVAWLAGVLGLDADAAQWALRHAGRASASSSALLDASLHLQADRAAPALERLRASREEGDERWAADQRGLVAQLCWQIGDLECARSEVAAGLEEFGSGIEGVDLFDGPDDLRRGARLGLVASRLGDATRGERLLRSVLERLQVSPRGAVSRWQLPRELGEAELLAALGEREAALAALESMLPDDGESVWLGTIADTSPRRSPFFEALRGEPRFEAVMDEIERRQARMAERVERLLAEHEG